MPKFRLSRRAMIRGAGSIAIGLPWLEAMSPEPTAKAATANAQRFIAVYQPGGTVLDRWRPSGGETDFTLSSILSPFEPVKDEILIIEDLDMKSAVGEQHQAGIVALLSGTPQNNSRGGFSSGPSLDQAIATIAKGNRPRASMEMAVRWATGKSHGLLHPINSMTFADDQNFSPISPRIDPVEIFDALFGNLNQEDDQGGVNPAIVRKQSILDYVGRRYETLSARLGMADRARLEEHLTKVREMEDGLVALGEIAAASCTPPELVDTSDYNPQSGLNADDNGAVKDQSSDAAIPKVGKLMMDMMVAAMACDLTAVGTIQWSDTEAKHTFPWLNLSEHHHFYQHDGGFKPNECAAICEWYSEQHSYLLQQMAAVDMGGHSLLDESIVFFGSELQEPPSHQKNSMPFVLAGRGGGLSPGRRIQYQHQSHNDLLLAILHLFGDERGTFGAAQYSNGPLSGLTG